MHISASVFVNKDERGLHADFARWLEALAPHSPVSQYRHNDSGANNADAHLKRQMMGREAVVAVTAGRLDFGLWKQILDGEFDSRRRERVPVKIIGEQAAAPFSSRSRRCSAPAGRCAPRGDTRA
jgi:secondary thiamine-phosphate synthase enzyme